MKTCLIVGNGLTKDLCKYTGMELDPNQPFMWQVRCSECEHANLLDDLQNAKTFIEDTRQRNPNINDFDIIGEFIKLMPENRDNWPDNWPENLKWIHCELRQYMALAYSNFQLRLDELDKANWPWIAWFRFHSYKIMYIVSFNYDLVLERSLETAGTSYYRVGVTNEGRRGIPIIKPHGSIDFEARPGSIFIPRNNRLNNITFRNYCPIVSLRLEEWLYPRIEADIVLPSEPSPQTRLTWVKKGRELFQQAAPTIERCIIIGLSYWRCDRPEIDWFIDQLQRNCIIEVVNPKPPPQLIGHLCKKEFTAGAVYKDLDQFLALI